MAYIDYLDPSRAGDLNFQRYQRTAALDRALNYDMAGYGGNTQKMQARGEQYGRDKNFVNQSIDSEGLDPLYDLHAQAARRGPAPQRSELGDGAQGSPYSDRPGAWMNPSKFQLRASPALPSDSFAAETGRSRPAPSNIARPAGSGQDYLGEAPNATPYRLPGGLGYTSDYRASNEAVAARQQPTTQAQSDYQRASKAHSDANSGYDPRYTRGDSYGQNKTMRDPTDPTGRTLLTGYSGGPASSGMGLRRGMGDPELARYGAPYAGLVTSSARGAGF